ncbi:MAG: hypothetical protein FWH35_01160 [Treponema sp.]|nr:hypothetical protein [Treponema sp.]
MTIKTRYILILMVLAILTALALSTCFTSYTGGTGTIVINIGRNNSRAAFEPAEIKAFTHTITLTGPGETQTKTIEGEGSVEFELIPGTWNIDVRAVGKTPDEYTTDDNEGTDFPSPMLRALSRETVEIITGPNKQADIKMEAATEVKSSKQLTAAIDIAINYSRKEVILITENIIFDDIDPLPYINNMSNITFLADKPVIISFPSDSYSSIYIQENSTLTLGRKGMTGHLTIDGNESKEGLFLVDGAELIMEEGVTIQNSKGGAVKVSGSDDGHGNITPGYFTMNGGKISGNKHPSTSGGGVSVANFCSFTMNGGEISGNEAFDGGGVLVDFGGTFIMEEGSIISGNKASDNGGGVYVNNYDEGSEGRFYMNGGTISGNKAEYCGGGVYVAGNPSSNVDQYGIFIKKGGIIYGSNEDDIRRNEARQGKTDNYQTAFGHAVLVDCYYNLTNFLGTKKVRDITADNSIDLNAAISGDGWLVQIY